MREGCGVDWVDQQAKAQSDAMVVDEKPEVP